MRQWPQEFCLLSLGFALQLALSNARRVQGFEEIKQIDFFLLNLQDIMRIYDIHEDQIKFLPSLFDLKYQKTFQKIFFQIYNYLNFNDFLHENLKILLFKFHLILIQDSLFDQVFNYSCYQF
jgi:hypothetical protein